MLDTNDTVPETTGLSQKDKKKLKALAHHIDPCVQVGRGGLSKGVITTISKALDDHELIKVQLLEASDLDRKEDSVKIAAQLKADLIQVIGFKVVLYRFNPAAKEHVLGSEE